MKDRTSWGKREKKMIHREENKLQIQKYQPLLLSLLGKGAAIEAAAEKGETGIDPEERIDLAVSRVSGGGGG